MGAVGWFKGLVEALSFRAPTAGTGEASAYQLPHDFRVLNVEELSSMSASQLKKYADQLRMVADGLTNLANGEKPAYPNFCSDLHNYLKAEKKVYLTDMTKALGKTENTIRTEVSMLRKSGLPIKKTYVRSKGKYQYYLDQAA